MNGSRRRLPRDAIVAGALLALVTVLFWKYRIYDLGTDPKIGINAVDLYVELIPTLAYGWSMLRAGHFPLWNPYQFCGEPFFAIGWTGLLYPPHWIRFFVDIPLSLELMLMLHVFWAAFGMWLLARDIGASTLGALCSAVTFAWSGWMTLNVALPPALEALSWMPFIALTSDRVARGRRLAWFWLIVAVTCQLMIGMTEIFVHTMYVAALLFACRLVQMTRQGQPWLALRRSSLAAAGVVAGLLVASPLLLATSELARQSTRAVGELSLQQVRGMVGGTIPPDMFLRTALDGRGIATVGVLPLVALPLAWSLRGKRITAAAGCLAATLGMLLVFGGRVFELYYHVPLVGGLFRRPVKFLDLYAFGQALLSGLAVTWLAEAADRRAADVWHRPAWIASLGLAIAGMWWLARAGAWNWYLAAAVALLLPFGMVKGTAARRAILLGIAALQGASLFFMVGNTQVRPLKRPQIFHNGDFLFAFLEKGLGDARVYLSPRFLFDPSFTLKQGQLRRVSVSNDYEPLAVSRYAKFFRRITQESNEQPFAGGYVLEPGSRWHLMDLTGTRYFVMARGEPAMTYMQQHPADFRPVMNSKMVQVFERTTVLPRAYLVAGSRWLSDADAVLAALDDPGFDARSEVLLEGPDQPSTDAVPSVTVGNADITTYEPSRVDVSVMANAAGYLLLHDLHYPGWHAYVDDHEVPIERANYLFRAVRIDPGAHRVRFAYRPDSFRTGLIVSACTALLIAGIAIGSRRVASGPHQRGAPPPAAQNSV